MGQTVKLKPAQWDDSDFAWELYAEAVKPHIAPYIAAKFDREWSDEVEKNSGFLSWWTPENTLIVMLGDVQVGWLHFEETETEITLLNYCIASEFRRSGIGSKVLEMLLDNWRTKQKPVAHSVLKSSPYQQFFERFGFQVVGEDDITLLMKCTATAADTKASAM